eukprot:767192-Hanusia_phi.AAC.3
MYSGCCTGGAIEPGGFCSSHVRGARRATRLVHLLLLLARLVGDDPKPCHPRWRLARRPSAPRLRVVGRGGGAGMGRVGAVLRALTRILQLDMLLEPTRQVVNGREGQRNPSLGKQRQHTPAGGCEGVQPRDG